MALAAGQLGPYEIIASLGAGGMGEVYRASDPRLSREVAIKLLPQSFSSDQNRLRRFEQEARAAAALNHPNILAVYDIGEKDGTPFIVSELLEGESLRERLRNGALSVRKSAEIAIQIAHGLAAAHDKGIVHRDLKPDNIFLTRDGQVKILDFGLAKLTHAEPDPDKTQASGIESDPGTVLGTVGYMSPEQVRGISADVRSDLFSFGAILYEMLSGKRAFHGDTAAETMSAILKDEPPDLTETNRAVAPALESIVRHCLEKNREERFQSARDVAFDLEMLSNVSSGSAALKHLPTKTRWRTRSLWLAALVALVIIAFFIGRSIVPPRENPGFHQLTFRRGTITYARFAPDGHSIVYSAKWDGAPPEPFSTRTDARGSIPLGIAHAEAVSISESGEMLVVLNRQVVAYWAGVGTLARVSMTGGAPRRILESVQDADWAPDGIKMAVVTYANQRYRLEYPVGKVLYESVGWITSPRVSPDSRVVAFLDHPTLGDDRGQVAVVDVSGNRRTLTQTWASENGLAWSPDGREIWFSASDTGVNSALYTVTLSGKQRLVIRPLGRLVLQDISRNGTLLVTNESARRAVFASSEVLGTERDLSFLDWTRNTALSPDGGTILFDEQGEGGGPNYSVYIRDMDGNSPPTRLGEDYSLALSPDRKWVLTAGITAPQQLFLVPVGPGEQRQLTRGDIGHSLLAFWLADGKHIISNGAEPGHASRAYLLDIDGGQPRPITPEGTGAFGVSPDGQTLFVANANGAFTMPVGGGDMRPIANIQDLDRFLGWAADSRSVYMFRSRDIPARVYKVDVQTGKRQFFRDLMPVDAAGLVSIGPIQITPDGKHYVYGTVRVLSDLYVVDGLK